MKKVLLKLSILIITVLALIWLFTTPASRIGYSRPYASPPSSDHLFTEQELNDFISVWLKAENSYIAKYMNDPEAKINGTTSWIFKQWLQLHDWNDQRFYYCEEKLRYLLKCVILQKNYDDNVKMAAKGNSSLEIIIKQQEEQLSVCSINPKEFNLINDNLSNLIKIIPQFM